MSIWRRTVVFPMLYLVAFAYSARGQTLSNSVDLRTSKTSRQVMSTSAKSVQISPEQMPREVMYEVLFREVARFCRKADALATQSRPDAFLRNHYRLNFELSESLDLSLKANALACAKELEGLDRRARAIVRATKKLYRNALPGQRGLIPPPPKELADLQEERNRIVLNTAENIAGVFGSAKFALFESQVRRYVGSHYRVSIPTVTNQ